VQFFQDLLLSMLSHVLLVGTNTTYTTLLRYRLETTLSVELKQVNTGREALSAINKATTLVVVAPTLPDGDGLQLIASMRAGWDDIPLLLVVPPEETEAAHDALAHGATDVVVAGRSDLDRMEWWIAQSRSNTATVAPPIAPPHSLFLIGNSLAIRRTRSHLRHAQQTDTPVLLQTESGLEPEAWARRLHEGSLRADAPFIAFDGAVLSDQAVYDTLFGTATTPGACARAEAGTLFIDNVSLLPADVQHALYTLAETGTLPAHAERTDVPFATRLVFGTCHSLEELDNDDSFSADLYDLIAQHVISLPALRTRTEDLLLIAQQLLREKTHAAAGAPISFSVPAIQYLIGYDWPGNYRELEAAIDRGLRTAQGFELTVDDLFPHEDEEDLPEDAPAMPPASSPVEKQPPVSLADEEHESDAPSDALPRSLFDLQAFTVSAVDAPPPDTSTKTRRKTPLERVALRAPDAIIPMEELQIFAIEHALDVCEGDIKQAARALGISPATVSHVASHLNPDRSTPH
jgi:DNA-binding NtrC family response regulator